MDKTQFERLSLFFNNCPDVCSVYLFGSSVTGGGWKKQADVDIGIFFLPDRCPSAEKAEQIKEQLEKELNTKVDVVNLNLAPPFLKYEVLKNGKLIYCTDDQKRVDFEVNSLLEFYDLEPLRIEMARQIKQFFKDQQDLR